VSKLSFFSLGTAPDVIPPEGYAYKCDDLSYAKPVLYKLFVLPIANRLSGKIAPNDITLLSQLFAFVPAAFGLCVAVTNPSPWWYAIVPFLGFLGYIILDHLDGTHARRTGQSSPLGELVDHWCDAWNGALVPFAWSMCWGGIHYPMVTTFLAVTGALAYAFAISEHKATGVMKLDPIGGNEGMLLMTLSMIPFWIWGRSTVLDVHVENQSPQRLANVLYYVPVAMTIRGRVAFSGDLLTQTIIDNDSAIFQKDPSMFVFGQGTMTVSYRPLPFAGRLAVDHVRLQLTGGRDAVVGGVGGKPVAPVPDVCQQQPPPGTPAIDCPMISVVPVDGLPEVEVFDRTGQGTWHRLPHFTQNVSYDLADPARYVDATGSILVRFVNNQQNPVNALMNVSIEGTIQ